LNNFVEKLRNKIHSRLHEKVSDRAMADIDKYMNELFFEYSSPERAFVHTDIQPKNIIYDEEGKKIS
jgi:hypothetical protein